MSEKNIKKKEKPFKKIMLIIAAVIVALIIAASIFWFSLASEMRNMILFMAFGGDSYDNYQEYQVIDSNDEPINPTSFELPVAGLKDANNTEVAVVTEMVKNEDSSMLKKGNFQTAGVDGYNGWYVMADEGAMDDSNPFGSSPLSYYTAGLAANLHTQILKAAEVKGVELDSVKVEVLNTFRWDDMMSADGAGFLDLSTTNIIIESNASEEVIEEIKEMALNSWTAGEALKNETEIVPSLVVNGDNWDNYQAVPGTTNSDESFVGDALLSNITDIPKEPEYLVQSPVETSDGFSFDMDAMSNMEFEIFAISESAENSERPYMKKITVSTPTDETWEIYSDEFMGGNDKPLAPTSLEYFTAGTALCLTSQTTLVSAMMGLDYTDYRVENYTDYRQEDLSSTDMVSYTDTVNSYIIIESEESKERLETFFNKSLSLCFAGEGLKNATDMSTNVYLNGNELN